MYAKAKIQESRTWHVLKIINFCEYELSNNNDKIDNSNAKI